MSRKVLLGIDIGTTATKAVLIDLYGEIINTVSSPSLLQSPRQGWAEEDADQWWRNVCQIIPECLAESGRSSEDVCAVGVSGMVPTIVMVGSDGKVLRPSIQQNDARASKEIEEFKAIVDNELILNQTGSGITQQSIGPKLLWLRRHEPELMSRMIQVMGSYDFIVYRLTGEYSIERNWALESGLYDFHTEDWIDDLLLQATIERRNLGRIRWPAEVVGGIHPEAARITGLRAGTPVVAGSADHIASAFSAGIKQQGDLLVKLGGAGDILYCVDRATVDPRLFLDYHVIPGKYLVNGCMASSGSLLQWFRNEFSPDSSFAALDELASTIPPGSEGLILLPYFLGEKTPLQDPNARGTLVGLTLSHKSAHIYRAILEGISYGFYHHLQVLAECGLRATRARVSNGGARSRLWKQITSDVLGLPLEQIEQHPGSSLGAAFIAGMGIGEFKEWDEIEHYIQVSQVVKPNMEYHAYYQQRFLIYREIYEALKDKYPRLT